MKKNKPNYVRKEEVVNSTVEINEKKKPLFLLTKEEYKELKGVLDLSRFRRLPYKQVCDATNKISYLNAFYAL
jgi:hypothetical protein